VTGDARRAAAAGAGRAGEAAAARHLEAIGHRVLERGYRTRDGEIDLVTRDGDTIVFVEVKTRSGTAHGRPAEAVDRRKQGRILRAARLWLHRHGATDSPCRFDVVEVLSRPGAPDLLEHLPDAFREGE
jgi:putative endonuclease